MSDHQEVKDLDTKETKLPKRYLLYDQLNINEKYSDYFIVATIILLTVVVIAGIL